MSNVHCPDCNVEMEVGYVPDMGDHHARLTAWVAGTAVPKTVFGLKLGSGIIKSSDPEARPIPIWAFRCPNCGLLRMHAIPSPETTSGQ
jgi:hypothetical protein